MMTTAKLLLHCPDKPGILAEVTDFITVNKGNIIYLDQYVDHVENIFFMRIEWELKDFLVPQEKIEDYFRTLYGQKYEMDFRLYFSDVKPRMAIFVSKLSHCLFDMLARYTAGEWNVEIPLIISNHPDLQHVAERSEFLSICSLSPRRRKKNRSAKRWNCLPNIRLHLLYWHAICR